MGKPHALLLPFPAQGHVIPMMELAHCLVDYGFKITLVNTESTHNRVMAALSNHGQGIENDDGDPNIIHLVSIQDGLEADEDRNDLGRLSESILKFMPGYLETLIRNANSDGSSDDEKITCFVADGSMGWSFEVTESRAGPALTERMGIRSAMFWPANAGTLATILSIPELIKKGIIDEDGTVKRQEMIQLSPGMPAMNTDHFVWNSIGDIKTQQTIFNYMLQTFFHGTETIDHIICNSIYNLELPVFSYAPKITPIGPLLTGQRSAKKPVGHFWPEDPTCTAWLDDQPDNSVIYVAFGSFTIFNESQFRELATGLERSGRSFLWVVRADTVHGYPDGFRERIAGRGKMVGWAPQQKVLAHPSIACFVSHCGWNSTMEGVRNGVLFLCWPYFADQFLNMSYICDVWRNGLGLDCDESGIISSGEIGLKVEELLRDGEFKERALVLKELADSGLKKGGSSFDNFNGFVDAMKK